MTNYSISCYNTLIFSLRFSGCLKSVGKSKYYSKLTHRIQETLHMSRQVTQKKRTDAPPIDQSRRPLQKLLIGFAMTFFGASMLLPFKDDTAGLWSVFSFAYSFNPFKWLFLIATLFYVRLIFRLHEAKLPIFRALVVFLLMLLAVGHLYFNRGDVKVGIGVIFWLASGYLLLAAAIRWRYPTRGLKTGFVAFIVFTSLSIWVQDVYRKGIASNIWRDEQAADKSVSENGQPENAAASQVAMAASAASAVSKPSELNAASLIKVERDFDLFNPWAQKGAPISCESLSKQHYPVMLPPRYLEDGYEWRNYQHGDAVCNNLLYIGTRYTGKPADITYKIWQDRRSNIYLMMSNQADQALFNESFTITRHENGLDKSDYMKKLNEGFAHLIDDDSAPEADKEYVFSKAETPTLPDTLPAGCVMQPIRNRVNTYQWGTGRVNFRGQSIVKPQTYCSQSHVGVVHLSVDVQAAAKGKTNTMEQRLHVKLFNASTLKPVQCGAVAIPLSASETLAWQAGQLKAELLQLDPLQTTGCLNVSVKLSNGRTLSSGK